MHIIALFQLTEGEVQSLIYETELEPLNYLIRSNQPQPQIQVSSQEGFLTNVPNPMIHSYGKLIILLFKYYLFKYY